MRNVYPLGEMRWAVKWEEEKQPTIVAQHPQKVNSRKCVYKNCRDLLRY